MIFQNTASPPHPRNKRTDAPVPDPLINPINIRLFMKLFNTLID
jgi:hypothetical protein